MTKTNTIRPAVHHWWPKGLQKHWAEGDSPMSAIFSSAPEEVKKTNPKSVGGIKDAHTIKFGDAPWDTGFEEKFSEVDSSVHIVVEYLNKIAEQCKYTSPIDLNVPALEKQAIQKLAASLIARSPRFRHAHNITLKDLHGNDKLMLDNLRAANAQNNFELVEDFLKKDRLFMTFVVDHDSRLIAGDGIPASFSDITDSWSFNYPAWVYVPILPHIGIIFHKLRLRYLGLPTELIKLKMLSNVEVKNLNADVQIYSKDVVFFKNQTGLKLIDKFKERTFMVYGNSIQANAANLAESIEAPYHTSIAF